MIGIQMIHLVMMFEIHFNKGLKFSLTKRLIEGWEKGVEKFFQGGCQTL